LSVVSRWRQVATSPAQEHDLVVLDLDGVVYVGAGAVPGAVEALTAVREAGARWAFATNNASRTPQEVAAHLRELGLDVLDREVVTSSQAGAALAVERVGAGARVLAVGGPGVAAACRDAGLQPVTSAEDHPAAVVQGYGRDVSWRHLAEATVAVRAGAVWVATNTDLTIPTERGLLPGNGSLVAVVRAAVGQEPLVAGKPRPGLFVTAARRVGAQHPLVVGDRLDTDIAGAAAAGQTSLLVLTGVSGVDELLGADHRHRPDLLSPDLAGLRVPHPTASRDADGWACRSARVRWDDGDVLEGDAQEGEEAAVDLLRAACAAAWERADAGGPAARPPRVSAALRARWARLGSGG
jgi:HAD superfamily hydrolase (TIGR01450 family)